MAFAILAALVFSCGAHSGETARVPVLGGLYSIEAPADWWVEIDDGGYGVSFAESEDAPHRVMLFTPIPDVEDMSVFTGLIIGSTFKKFGGNGEVVAEREDEFHGYPAVQAVFTIAAPNGTIIAGIVNAFDINGYTAAMLAVGPAEGFDEFIEAVDPILESYQVDEAALDKRKGELAAIGEAIAADIAKALAE